MKGVIATLLFACVALAAAAGDEGRHAPQTFIDAPPVNTPVNLDTIRQGGDTIDDAFVIRSLPFFDTGTTVGYGDDYEESCPFFSPAPDVVYRLVASEDGTIEIDLWGSLYDTLVFVYDVDFNLIACDDDFHGTGGASYIRDLHVQAGSWYYIVVDSGAYGDAGQYRVEVQEYAPCELNCQGEVEGEPPLAVDYHDDYNGGCASSYQDPPMQALEGGNDGVASICGRSGWYQDVNGVFRRDIDSFVAVFGSAGLIEVTMNQQEHSMLYNYSVAECSSTELLDFWYGPYCHPETVTISGEPGAEAWIVFAPYGIDPPYNSAVYEYEYSLTVSGLADVVAVEDWSWSTVRGVFR